LISVRLLNLLQLRIGLWIARTAIERMEREHPPPREPRSLPPHITS
jgi:hypothetical protein